MTYSLRAGTIDAHPVRLFWSRAISSGDGSSAAVFHVMVTVPLVADGLMTLARMLHVSSTMPVDHVTGTSLLSNWMWMS